MGIPDSPACDANRLHHMDTELTNVDEEKHKEAERAITPAERKHESERDDAVKCVCG